MGSIPTHPPDCATLVYPWNCPECGQPIFHLKSTCGSSVLLDRLGRPWSVHHHHHDRPEPARPSWLDSIDIVAGTDGSITATISDWGINVIKPGSSGSNILPQPDRGPATRPPSPRSPIVAIPPSASQTCEIVGVVRHIERKIDHMKMFGYVDDGPMAVAMAQAILGARWAAEFGRITIHAGSADHSQLHSYTACFPLRLIGSSRIKPGVSVSAVLTGVDVSDRCRYWHCDRLQIATGL